LPNAELNLGDIFLARGDLPAARRRLLERVDRFARDPATSAGCASGTSIRLYASLGEVALAQGDLDQARRHAERCLELATRTNARKNLVKGWRLAARWHPPRGDGLTQSTRSAKARTIAEAIGNPTQLCALTLRSRASTPAR
jgi:hypothetical protein